ncbi:DUF6215 domain-containing protein [Streptomyces sp. BB1-1-1]|uniref:DUF6215 domain-containing protein n=1 Tax=Streptomyces sp. BB1-1-1 TaxID=3074430 RepID=UPI0028780386|nr:DUF6215 domain-containing protein [Streptomyces sp. BB1-1-1]WND39148.1 DUF6215 domain-containing protein [Streptomyces sp. BB1-1-1]
MTDDSARPEKGMSAAAQAITAVVLVGALAGGMWTIARADAQSSGKRGPATCSATDDAPPSKRVSGMRLCTALNRPDLPALLGTPEEPAQNAYGNDEPTELADGRKIPTPEATVRFETYTVKLSASYDDVSVAGTAELLGETAQAKKVLGRAAALYSNRTIPISFGGDGADAGPGGIARSLLVARDAKDSGGSYELSVWREDGMPPDDAMVLRVAERVLPTVPGWTAG